MSEPTVDPVYHEPARGYGTVLALVVIFAAGCAADVLLTGREVHVIGWAVAVCSTTPSVSPIDWVEKLNDNTTSAGLSPTARAICRCAPVN